jgi:NDP-4-keto-2,6-dideoxyhexose 3-C-methyltransferase
MKYRYHQACRVCGAPLDDVLDLGTLHLNHFPETITEVLAPPCPLVLALCPTCGLVQLRHTVPPETMYRHYWYLSGINEMMVANLEEIVAQVTTMIPLKPGDTVIDIGANDGTLLAAYKRYGHDKIRTVAFEPAKNLMGALHENAMPTTTINDFFPCRSYRGPKAKIITSIAMFYDLENPGGFVQAIKETLRPDGLWVLELAYLPDTIKRRAFDSICHEHLEYYTLQTLDFLLGRHGLRVIDAETNQVNGGSMRVFVGHRSFPSAVKGRQGSDVRIRDMLIRELKMRKPETFEWFAGEIERVKDAINTAVTISGVVDLYGASTKGNTLLQVCGIGPQQVRWALERSEAKWGRHTITMVPIVNEQLGREDPADLWLVLPWHFRDSFLLREQAYLNQGGKMLFPMPHREIVMRAPMDEVVK